MKKSLIILILVFIIIASGCIVKVKKDSAKNVFAGVYKSFDKGNSWQAKNILVVGGGLGSIAGVNINEMFFDPQDNNAIYLTTQGQGILYTYSAGENWFQPPGLKTGAITSIAVSPKDKCVIYAAQNNRLLKSVDCNRSWREIYIDARNIEYTSLVIDGYNDKIIYTGNVKGEIIKSYDYGVSWTTIARINNKIIKILLDQNDSRIIYAATESKGVHKSTDGGESWQDLSGRLKNFSNANKVTDLIMNSSVNDSLFLLSRYGILKTYDGGENWEALNLITPPLSTTIYAIAVNPHNENEIYYGTATTFYKTANGGANWVTKRLPTGAAASNILVDPYNPIIIYLGTKLIK